MTENAVLTPVTRPRTPSRGSEWATLIVSVVGVLAVVVNPMWGLLFAFAGLAFALLHLLRRVGRLSWMVASLCVSGAAILFGVGYAIALTSVHEEVGIGYSRDFPGEAQP